MIISCQCDSN